MWFRSKIDAPKTLAHSLTLSVLGSEHMGSEAAYSAVKEQETKRNHRSNSWHYCSYIYIHACENISSSTGSTIRPIWFDGKTDF
jgi:hypothetical protein